MSHLAAQFLSQNATIPALAIGGTSLRAAKRAAAKQCRSLGAGVSATVHAAGEAVSYYDGARWRDLYRAEFLSRVYGVTT